MNEEYGDYQMRAFLSLTEQMLAEYARVTQPVMIVEEVVEESLQPTEHPILEDCRSLVEKLRTFMESESGGEYALGVETGMQRAADMIENLIRRFEQGDGL